MTNEAGLSEEQSVSVERLTKTFPHGNRMLVAPQVTPAELPGIEGATVHESKHPTWSRSSPRECEGRSTFRGCEARPIVPGFV